MFCTKCGKEIADDSCFCTNCGNPINATPVKILFEKEENFMEEKILAQSKPKTPTIPIVLIIVGIVLLIITIVTHWSWDDFALVMLFVSPAISVVGVVLYFLWSNTSATITDKRVYGVIKRNARVDIPLDSISAIGTTSLTHGLTISSSSGVISLPYIQNLDEMHSVLSNIIMERQKKSFGDSSHLNNGINDVNELKKFKELLDCGIITQEEFDAKKKQLLGL